MFLAEPSGWLEDSESKWPCWQLCLPLFAIECEAARARKAVSSKKLGVGNTLTFRIPFLETVTAELRDESLGFFRELFSFPGTATSLALRKYGHRLIPMTRHAFLSAVGEICS